MFQENPTKENEFYIANQLGWKSVSKMRKGLSNQEYLCWEVYFARIKQREELEIKAAKAGM